MRAKIIIKYKDEDKSKHKIILDDVNITKAELTAKMGYYFPEMGGIIEFDYLYEGKGKN